MLVLSRLKDEWIDVIQNGHILVSFCIVENREGNVRLGFEAPPELGIVRRELRERMEARGEAFVREGK